MTYIKLTNDMSLVVTKNDTIYRGENMSNEIIFLIPVQVNNIDMETATLFLSYIRADGEPDMVILECASEKYDEYNYQYVLPVTCKLSRYPGQVTMWLQICDGDAYSPIIAKSGECILKIHESKSMDDYLCDHQLTAIYQMKKQVDNIVDTPPSSGDSGDNNPDDDSNDNSDDPSEFDGFEVVEF